MPTRSTKLLKVLSETLVQLQANHDVNPEDVERLRQIALRMVIQAEAANDTKSQRSPAEA